MSARHSAPDILRLWPSMVVPLNKGAGGNSRLSHIVPVNAKLYLAQETCGMNVNTPARPYSGTMDVDEFMAFLETRPDNERWDLIEGVAVMMAPPSYAHQRITRNFCELLNSAFSEQRLDLFAYFSAGVRNPGLRDFQPEPDVVVVPGVAGDDLYSEKFQLAGEIMSPTNTRREI